MEYVIQHLVIPSDSKHLQCRELFYRGSKGYLDLNKKTLLLGSGQAADFVTYFNSCSYRKWKKYTCAGRLHLYIDIEGSFGINLVGYDFDNASFNRKDYQFISGQAPERRTLEFVFPENNEQINGFEISTPDKCIMYGGYYTVECDEADIRDVNLCIATTTFKKEDFIRKNVHAIQAELLDNNDDISKHIFLHVIDNGKTLTEDDIQGHNTFLHPNNNAGGSGGYARGMIEALHQSPKATHVLLMDDDVLILPESIRRTYHLLKLIKDDYKENFISGAMLYYELPYRQLEDIGTVLQNGHYNPKKPNFDHRFLEEILKNENDYVKQPREYAAWWYCCIPVAVIEKNGLPLPLFIRWDDAEYSLRCKAEIITMNGICIWHMGFVTKYNAAMVEYQEFRNRLIAAASSDILNDVDVDGCTYREFRLHLLKYNYDAAELVLHAFRDFLKGPDFLKVDRGAEIVKENAKLNDSLVPLETFENVSIIDPFECYHDAPRSLVKKALFRGTYNGHLFIPEKLLKKDPAIVSFDGAYQPEKMALHKQHLEVNPFNRTGRMLTIDKKRFVRLMREFHYLKSYYKKHRNEIIQKYHDEKAHLTSEAFWRKYLHI